MMVAAALAGLGGPVLGVCLGRWWRWPGAALLATVILVAWAVLTLFPLDSKLGNLWHMSAPFVLWISGTTEDPTQSDGRLPRVAGGLPPRSDRPRRGHGPAARVQWPDQDPLRHGSWASRSPQSSSGSSPP